MKSPSEIFQDAVKGKNFMTPDVIRYGTSGRYIYELSKGYGFRAEIFGVTVVTKYGERRNDLSKCCHSLEEAEEYIKCLKRLSEA